MQTFWGFFVLVPVGIKPLHCKCHALPTETHGTLNYKRYNFDNCSLIHFLSPLECLQFHCLYTPLIRLCQQLPQLPLYVGHFIYSTVNPPVYTQKDISPFHDPFSWPQPEQEIKRNLHEKCSEHNITAQLTSWLLPSLLVYIEEVKHPAIRTLAESFHISTAWQRDVSWKSTTQTDWLTALGKSTAAHTAVTLYQILPQHGAW